MARKGMSQARIDANRRYDAKAYDRISFTVPKGQKASIQAAVKILGDKSVNLFMQRAALQRMGLDDWPLLEEP